MKARIRLQKDCIISPIDPRVFGSFIEHLGRAVYTGIYEPGHPTADAFGFRGDVEELIRPLHVTQIRYPGGNFLSGYDWRDGIGPKDKRPVRPDMAWSAIEPNQVGTDEFLQWCERIGAQPMMAVNLGTGTPKDAVELLEYCNGDMHTYWADKRRENGREAPYNVKLWCLGNEMDGPWQMGHKTASEYGRIAAETSRLMKFMDPTIETVACGSSNLTMPTFGSWEYTVLDECYDEVDYLSLHQYYGNYANDTVDFLASSKGMDDFISGVVAICDAVKAKKHGKKQINLSFDEWNVWYHSNEQDQKLEKWVRAPHQLEDVYNFEDALLVGSMLITLLRHADRVKIACLAQLVNVIAPIMTSDTGAWRQTIFYPYMHASVYGRGTVLNTQVLTPVYESKTYGEAPYLDSVCIWDEENDALTIFAVNKSLDEDMEVSCDLRQFEGCRLAEHIVLTNDDMKAVNTEADPNHVTPTHSDATKLENGKMHTVLGKHSWNVIRLTK